MTQQRALRLLIVCGCLSWASVGNADVVVDWNIITAQTIAAVGRPGPAPLFDYAMVHTAIHDAVQAFDGRFEPYNVAIPNAAGSSVAAAAALRTVRPQYEFGTHTPHRLQIPPPNLECASRDGAPHPQARLHGWPRLVSRRPSPALFVK
jgi:hypothetical protein